MANKYYNINSNTLHIASIHTLTKYLAEAHLQSQVFFCLIRQVFPIRIFQLSAILLLTSSPLNVC